MSETNETKEKSGKSAILLFLLALFSLWLWKQKRDRQATEANADTISDYSGGGGGSGYDGAYADDVVVVDVGNGNGNGGSYSGGASSGSVTPIKQAMTARTLDPEWQAQKSRINMNLIPDYQKRQIEKGAVTTNTLKSIADYQQVKAGNMSAFDYANDPNMPEEMRAGIEYSSTAYQGSATTVRNRALSYYAGITGAHRGSMSAAERTAWDSANEQAALTAYAAAAGSGLQADTARALAGKTTSNKTTTTKTTTNKTATASKSTSGLGLGASKGSAQPGKSSSSSTAKTATKTVAKAAATKGIAGAVRAAASLSKK